MTLFKHSSKMFSSIGFFMSMAAVLFLTNNIAFSQESSAALEQRVVALEDYAATIHPTMVELSDNLNQSIRQYTSDLESSLEAYSRKLQRNLDQRLDGINQKRVIINPFSKSYQSIETNTGVFLIAIERVEQIEGGVRLHINIGNPNYADYQDFELKFIWGQKRSGDPAISYEQWRQSLNGVAFSFNGKIEKGKWNTMAVDLIPVGQGELGYLECEMNVSSVQLGIN